MTIASMTGCGRGQVLDETGRIVVEIATVNAKYLDINLRCPSFLGPIVEHGIRDTVHTRLERGRVNIQIVIERTRQGEQKPAVDIELAKAYQEQLDGLLDQLDIAGQVDLHTLIRQPGVLTIQSGDLDSTLTEKCTQATRLALDELEESRAREGKKLEKDISKHLEKLEKLLDEVKEMTPAVLAGAKKRMQERIAELAGGVVDEVRLGQEVAIMAERVDTNEELVRLAAHHREFGRIMDKGGRIGRKLDFMLQELNREWNTLSVKSQDSKISHLAVVAKDLIEKIREQVQNIE